MASARPSRYVAILVAALVMLGACTEPPSWQTLLSRKITDHYPDYRVQPAPGGGLLVSRPGLAALPVDVDAIARFCQRGPKDCNYATDQMLLVLGQR